MCRTYGTLIAGGAIAGLKSDVTKCIVPTALMQYGNKDQSDKEDARATPLYYFYSTALPGVPTGAAF